jgi:hypothetical protein
MASIFSNLDGGGYFIFAAGVAIEYVNELTIE